MYDWADPRLVARHRFSAGAARVVRVALAPSAGRLVAADAEGRVGVWTLDGRRLGTLDEDVRRVSHLDFDRAGERVLVSGATPGAGIHAVDGRCLVRLAPTRGSIGSLLDARFADAGVGVVLAGMSRSLRVATADPVEMLRIAESRIDDALRRRVEAEFPEIGSR